MTESVLVCHSNWLYLSKFNVCFEIVLCRRNMNSLKIGFERQRQDKTTYKLGRNKVQVQVKQTLFFTAYLASKLSYLGKRSEPRENRERGVAGPSLGRSRETRFTRPNRRACSQAICSENNIFIYTSVNSSWAQSPPGYCGAFAGLVSPGGGAFAKFVLPEGRAFANPGAIPELLSRTRFPIRI